MRKILVAALFAVCASAHAAPEGTPDDLGSFLSSKGLINRLDRARQVVSNKAADLVITSMGFLGVPYKRGGSSLETGFDCSGFVRAMYEQVSGLVLPHKAEQQAKLTQKINRDELQPGDLVFFNTMRRAFSHVGIYVGDGKFIHSPKPGAAVRVEDMRVAYWTRRFDGARRLDATDSAAPSQPAAATDTEAGASGN